MSFVKKCLYFLLLLSALPSRAQDAAEFRRVMQYIKGLQTYSYETETRAVFPGGKADSRHSKLYMDVPRKRLCYRNEDELVLLTPEWVFKALHARKQASVFNVASYNRRHKNVLPEIEAIFRNNINALFVDSVLLGGGRLLSAKKQGSKTTFTVGFPEGASLKEVVLVYDYTTRLPESVRMRSVQVLGYSGGKAKEVKMEMTARHYTASVPDPVFDLSQYFSVRNGKAVLAQYKNYKLTSIL